MTHYIHSCIYKFTNLFALDQEAATKTIIVNYMAAILFINKI